MAETKKSVKSGTASKSGLDSIDTKKTVEVKSTAKKKDNADKKVKETKKAAKKTAKKSAAKSEKKSTVKTTAETNQKKSVQNGISSTAKRPAEKGNAAAKSEKQPEPVKKTETSKEVKITDSKAPEQKKIETKKEAAPAKSASKAEEVKKETVKEEKPAAKTEKKESPVTVEEAVVEVAPGSVEAVVAEETAAPVKEAAKEEPAEKPAPAKEEIDIAEKLKHYNSFDLDTEIAMLQAMGIQKSKEDIQSMLIASDDEAQIALDLLDEAGIKPGDFDFEEDGYDYTLVPVVINRIGSTMDFKASDFKDITDEVKKAIDFKMTDDAMENAESYKNMLDLVRKVLVLAQEKNITSLDELEKYIPADIKALVVKFMDTAYDILKNWQYNDVKFYEGFIYAVLSQFDELHNELGNRAMMDVADLYIIHGDFGKGDADYNYILRENKLKDYIYYRFANIYNDIDRNKAKAIAGGALRYVDGRYTYYPNIMQILEN